MWVLMSRGAAAIGRPEEPLHITRPPGEPHITKSHQDPRVNGAEAEKPGLEATGAWILRLLTAGAHWRATGTCLLWKLL